MSEGTRGLKWTCPPCSERESLFEQIYGAMHHSIRSKNVGILMKKLRKLKKGLAILIAIAMVVAMMPGTGTLQAQAQESQVADTTSTTKTIVGIGTGVIADPTDPGDDTTKAWAGSYVYYGNYDSSPVKYRVLDASTTDYSAEDTEGNKVETMLLDCDSILYRTPFDVDNTADADGKEPNDWSISDVKSSLNGGGFLNKEGVFTTAEKNVIAESNVATHELRMHRFCIMVHCKI